MDEHPDSQRGVTLIEAAVAMTLVAIAVSTAVPGFQGLVARKRVEGVATQLATDLQTVRTTAVARNEPLRISFHAAPGGTCYVIHTGAKLQCSCVGPAPAACLDGAEQIRTVWLPATELVTVQASAGSILFDPLHGTSTPTGTVRVSGTPGAIHHVVNVMGRVRSCSPDGVLPGYRPC
jgi:type IV fimbrial biogenesis protein FimT